MVDADRGIGEEGERNEDKQNARNFRGMPPRQKEANALAGTAK